MIARAHLESLLKARKLDVTLTSAAPWLAEDPDARALTGVPAIDHGLGGGLRRGHLSEIVGGRSSGRTSLMVRALLEAAARGELVALIDAADRFDPASASDAGLDLARLLWVRGSSVGRRTGVNEADAGVARAIKAMNLVLQAGGFGLVVLDLADAPPAAVGALPFTTWFRLARIIEGTPTVALVVVAEHVGRSAGGATIVMDGSGRHGVWQGGRSDRARLLTALDLRPRIINGASLPGRQS